MSGRNAKLFMKISIISNLIGRGFGRCKVRASDSIIPSTID